MWDLPQPGIKPVSSSLAGRFLTIGPTREVPEISFYVKPSNSCFCVCWLCCVACGILVPWPGIKPVPPTVEAESLNHWIARDVLEIFEVLKTHYWKNVVQTRQNHWVCWIWSVGHQFATFVQARRQEPWKHSSWKVRLNLPSLPSPHSPLFILSQRCSPRLERPWVARSPEFTLETCLPFPASSRASTN